MSELTIKFKCFFGYHDFKYYEFAGCLVKECKHCGVTYEA